MLYRVLSRLKSVLAPLALVLACSRRQCLRLWHLRLKLGWAWGCEPARNAPRLM